MHNEPPTDANRPVESKESERTDGVANPKNVGLGRARKRRRNRHKRVENTTNAEAGEGLFKSVRDAMDALRKSTLALARSRGQDRQVEGIELKLTIRRDSTPEALADDYFRELNARFDEAQAVENDVVANRAFCFRCDSFLCDHAAPPDSRSVMSNYEPTGRPVWTDFASLLYHRRDPRAEAVANRTAGILTLIIEGAEVAGDRIEAFGGAHPPVEVLCELTVGMFPLSQNGEEGALTLQWLRLRKGGRERVLFHPIGDARLLGFASLDSDLARLLAAERSTARTQPAHSIKKREPDGADYLIQFATGRAHALSRDLQHHYSARGRRTLHARERAEVGERPTSMAFPEARAARDQSIYIDRKTATYVLLGKNSRVHFFNKKAAHVTSVRFSGEEITTRIDKGRWRPADAREISLFREQIQRQMQINGSNGAA
ncbi:MAG: hypothetical protein HY286_10715 [Planctomycetes bacterium]|nr:hypothetical protein [Planctomycetota bacterium]